MTAQYTPVHPAPINRSLALIRTLFTLVCMSIALPGMAQDVRYVSDVQYVSLRSGQGTSHPITHRGIRSGTRFIVHETNTDSGYSRVSTASGSTGWVGNQYLMNEPSARSQLQLLEGGASELQQKLKGLSEDVANAEVEKAGLQRQLEETELQRSQLSSELIEVKQLSGNALTLDVDNRRLVGSNEMLLQDLQITRAEVTRLRESEKSDAFINGALAVLIGVMITLAVPRLWPKKRRNSEWA
ncbi:MAG: SH3 domain protein [Halieaceae bacterium]